MARQVDKSVAEPAGQLLDALSSLGKHLVSF